MKHLLIRGLALSLGLLATSARGQETVWRSTPAAPGTTQGVSTGKPIAIAVSRPATTQPTPPAAPAVSIGRPVAIAGSDPAVRPVSFATSPESARPIIRGAAPDALARPMPSFGAAGDPLAAPAGLGNWRRPGDVVGASRTATDAGAATPVAIGTSTSSGTVLPSPTPVDSLGVPSVIAGQPVLGGPSVIAGQPVLGGPPSSLFATNGNCGCGAGGGPVVDCAPGCGCGKNFVGGRMTAGNACCAGGGCAAGGGGAPGLWGRYVEPMFAGMGDPDGGMNSPRLALNAEYLLWWMKGDRTPPLAVAVPTVGGVPAGMGSTLIGGNLATNSQSGARVSATYWFSDQGCWAIDVGGFFLGFQDKRYVAGGGAGANPVIGRPFFDASAGGAAALELVAGLGILQGNVEVVHRSTLWGYDINMRRNLVSDCSFTMDLLFGFREVGLDESLRITENLTQTAAVGGFPAGSNFVVRDQFSTKNRFYGGQVGLAGLWRINDVWSLGFTGKVAVGTTQQIVDIYGSTTVTPPGGVGQTLPGGLLTQNGTNIGHYVRNHLGVVPEAGLTLGYQVTDWWRLTAGYNFLYWNNVARPGSQVNTTVNRTLLPFRGGAAAPGAQPAFLGRTTDYYAQGVTFGMLFTF